MRRIKKNITPKSDIKKEKKDLCTYNTHTLSGTGWLTPVILAIQEAVSSKPVYTHTHTHTRTHTFNVKYV
jgi:hypothetical protein